MSRQQLLELYGDRVAVQALPEDFAVVRREAVWFEDGRLILGEYGEGARIACLTAQSCIMSDHYQRMAGFKHIHAIQKYGSSGKFLVSTGEARKVLDLWVHSDGKLRFERRLRRWLAGFTAAIEVDGVHYFGSDFSLRPNFIVTLDGAKYFFPQKAYKLHPSVFYSRFDRYLVSVNKQLDPSGGRRTLSVFDTKSRRFIFCDDLES
ncbi:MAG TPA: hypothetical protein VH680_09615 [Gemmatimonadales bacterium]|jgi:hypothetical protein